MLTNKDIEVAREIAKHLDLPAEFGGHEDMDTSEYEYDFQDFIEGDFYVSCGVSKLVIVIEDLPFVIKIPFNGRWEMDWENEDKWYFNPFYSACDECCDDYCLDELEKTLSIQETKFAHFVPDMVDIGIFCGHAVYIQEKVKPLCDCSRLKTSERSLQQAKLQTTTTLFRTDWIARVYDLYGQDTLDEFVEFLKTWEPEVLSDMHTGNYGITLDGAPVLFDLAGFRD